MNLELDALPVERYNHLGVFAPIAQLVEQQTLNLFVVGSSPTGGNCFSCNELQ